MSKCRYDLSEDCNNTDCLNCVLDKIGAEIHGAAVMKADGEWYLNEKWIMRIIDKYSIQGK